MGFLLAPSLLSADHARLGEEIHALEKAGADWLHVDVMDGHFVPNLTWGPCVVQALRKVTALSLDVHLMIENPDASLASYAQAGADGLTVHAEACLHLHRTLSAIRTLGVRVGVALNPATPLTQLQYILHHVDVVLIMTVNPGFGGQALIAEVIPKIQALKALKQARGLSFYIEVDGGVGVDTMAQVVQAGADVVVAGAAVFEGRDYAAALRRLRAAAA